MKKYVLDSNFFIRGFRDAEENRRLQEFHRLYAPFEYLSAIVAQELRAGTRSKEDLHQLERHVLNPFGKRGRVLTPSKSAWDLSGNLLSEMAGKEGLELSRLRKSFGNDVLLALSCLESGAVLVTENLKDFERIAKYKAFEFTDRWPD